jgi:hypothetical protein
MHLFGAWLSNRAFDFSLSMDNLRRSIGDRAGVDGYMTEDQLTLTAISYRPAQIVHGEAKVECDQ